MSNYRSIDLAWEMDDIIVDQYGDFFPCSINGDNCKIKIHHSYHPHTLQRITTALPIKQGIAEVIFSDYKYKIWIRDGYAFRKQELPAGIIETYENKLLTKIEYRWTVFKGMDGRASLGKPGRFPCHVVYNLRKRDYYLCYPPGQKRASEFLEVDDPFVIELLKKING